MLLQLKIQIKGISRPPVWRRLLVPDHFTFHRFHQVIQEAFGWQDYHLYLFSPKGYGSRPLIGLEEDEWADEDLISAKKVKLRDYFGKKGQTFTYIYDFGDDWTHRILVEEVIDQKGIRAELLAGKGACPPEDCGGPWGYEDMKETVSDPEHEMYDELRDWLGLEEGEAWDAQSFDLNAAKAAVSSV